MGFSNARTVVVTGGSSGIGAQAARVFAQRGDRVIITGRNPQRTRAVAADIHAEYVLADFDRLDEVRGLAAELLQRTERIHVLSNNAGGIATSRSLTVDGHERMYQANLLAPFLLTELLLPRLIATASTEAAEAKRAEHALGEQTNTQTASVQAEPLRTTTDRVGTRTNNIRPRPVRIVSTASTANRYAQLKPDDLDYATRPWLGGWPAYGASKLGVILWTRTLAERLTGTGVEAFSVHPGVVRTSFGADSAFLRWAFRRVGPLFMISPRDGADPLIALGSDVPINALSGTYFQRFTPGGGLGPGSRYPHLPTELATVLARDAGLTKTVAQPSETVTKPAEAAEAVRLPPVTPPRAV